MTTVTNLPHWDMSVVYPSMESQEFQQGFARVIQDIKDLAQLLDACHVEKQEQLATDAETIKNFETVLQRYNEVLAEHKMLSTYISCFVNTNTLDTLAQARMSELQQTSVILSQLGTRFTAWIGSLDVETLIARSHSARTHTLMLRKAKIQAAHLMSPAEENLASELNLSGGTAWEKLHSDVTSQLVVALEQEGERKELPMSMVRNLAYESDRETRRRAYEAELAGWQQVAVPLAAALNSIKGEVNVVSRRRGWETPLVLQPHLCGRMREKTNPRRKRWKCFP